MKCSRAVLAFALSLTLSAPALAASLSLAPVGLDLAASEKAASISLTNKGAAPISLQVRIFKWSQIDGKDHLEPTRAVLVSPPAATVPAGATYTLRVVRVATSPVAASESYRLFIDELPRAVDARSAPQAVSMVLRTSLPVFFTGSDEVARVSWKVWRDADGLYLEGANTGGRHLKLTDLALETAAGRLAFAPGLAGYILPGAVRRFDLKLDPKLESIAAQLSPGTDVIVTAKAGRFEIKDHVRVSAP